MLLHRAARARLNRAQAQAPIKPRRCSEHTRRGRTSTERPPAEARAAKKRANPAEHDHPDIDAKKADADFRSAAGHQRHHRRALHHLRRTVPAGTRRPATRPRRRRGGVLRPGGRPGSPSATTTPRSPPRPAPTSTSRRAPGTRSATTPSSAGSTTPSSPAASTTASPSTAPPHPAWRCRPPVPARSRSGSRSSPADPRCPGNSRPTTSPRSGDRVHRSDRREHFPDGLARPLRELLRHQRAHHLHRHDQLISVH